VDSEAAGFLSAAGVEHPKADTMRNAARSSAKTDRKAFEKRIELLLLRLNDGCKIVWGRKSS
jgi:hypothetical protein